MTDSRKYYEAYDDRFRQVHKEGLRWFSSAHSPILAEVIADFGIAKTASVLEIGCGEGRDAAFLLQNGFQLLATDVSPAAVSYCRERNPEYEASFAVLDCLTQRLDRKFDFIYAVAVIHMLVLDEDRDGFYRFVRDQLEPDGFALICTMGNGELERKSDIDTAFDLQERIHEQTGRTLSIAGTSCRIVNFDTFLEELRKNDLSVIKHGITAIEPDFPQMMYAVVKRN